MGLRSWMADLGLVSKQGGPHYAAQPDSPFQYRLEHWDARKERGRGYLVVRNADGQTLSWHTLPRSHGLESISVVGEKYKGRLEALQDRAFSPGRPLQLVREPKNPYDPNAVAVFDAGSTLHVGYLPKGDAARITKELDAGKDLRCYAMWETLEGRRRVQLRVLLLGENASVEIQE